MFTIDSTIQQLDSLSATAVADTLVSESARGAVAAEELFGAGAVVAPVAEGVGSIAATTFASNPVVSLLLVGLFVGYLFILFAYGGYAGQMVKIILGDHIGIRVADELSFLFMRAVRSSVALGTVVWSLFVARALDGVAGEAPHSTLALWLAPLLVVVLVALGAVQRLLSDGICHLVRRADLARGLNILADTTMALVTLVVTPVVLLFVANVGATAPWFGWGAIVVALAGLLIFAVKSLIFFLEQKISILLWFLYLCTVVLIPIGALVTLGARSGAI